ncbi:MAG: 2-hydroxyacyl-CoA dehydratase [Nitrospirae bacterium]|nr:2-hydroxyacyl-CoA dehydratase [Nitrospirota bacterium]
MAEARNRNQKIAAVMPYHYPRALLRAHGIHPIEVWGPPGVDSSAGNQHFQAYTCALVRQAASFLIGQGPGMIDLVLIPHNCDALQGMGSVLRDFAGLPSPVLTVYLPKGRREADLQYLSKELRRLATVLGEISGRSPSDTELCEAIAIESAADEVFSDACLHRRRYPVSDRTFYQALRSREYLPPGQFVEFFRSLPANPQDGDPVPSRVKLLLSGIVPEPMDLFDRLNEMGAEVVSDDLACGSRRLYRTPHNGPQDPYDLMAATLMGVPPDPISGAPIPDRIEYLLARVRESGARGVLVYDVKFCEPELFDLPQVRDALTSAGFPFLYVEHELGATLSGQALTRMEAFVEMLR